MSNEERARMWVRTAKWAKTQLRLWNARRPERQALAERRRSSKQSRKASKVEAQRVNEEQKALKGMVRRTCKQCGHEWVIPKRLIKAGKQASAAAILGSPVPAIAFGGKVIDMDTCAKCGSVRFFTQESM